MLIYTLYGYRKSHLGRGIVDLAVVPEDECVRSLEDGLDNAGFQHELAELGLGRLRRTQRSLGGHSYASARSRHKESFHSAREEDSRRQSFRSVQEEDERKASFKSFTESSKSSHRPSLAVQSISSSEQSPSSQRGVRGVPDGRSSATETLTRQGASRSSFRSIKSDVSRSSFKSVRSDDGRESFRSAIPDGRRSRYTSDSWKSASSGDSQRSTSSSRPQPGTARSASPPDVLQQRNVPTISADISRAGGLSHTPPTSRRATPADLTRTPPSSRRTTASDLSRTPPRSARGRHPEPETPGSRGQVEILINPRQLCEEIYQTSAAPAWTGTAPMDMLSRSETSRIPAGEPMQTVGKVASPAKDDGYAEGHSDDSGGSSCSDSDWDGEERRRYSDADIEAASVLSNGSGGRSVSSDSSGDEPETVRTPLAAAVSSQGTSKLADLAAGDLAPVPGGKRSLSMSDVSYDDDESDNIQIVKLRHGPGNGRALQPPAQVAKDERPENSHNPETSDDNVPRVHNLPWARNVDILAHSSPKIVPSTQNPLHQTFPCVQKTADADHHMTRDLETHSITDADASSTSTCGEEENDHHSLHSMNDEMHNMSKDVPDIHAPPTARGNIIQDLEDQIRQGHAKQEQIIRRGSVSSEEKSTDIFASILHDPGQPHGENGDGEHHNRESDKESSPSENSVDVPVAKVPKVNLNKSFSDDTDSDRSSYRSRTGSENSAALTEELPVTSHLQYSNNSGSQSETSSQTSLDAVAENTDSSNDSDRDSLPSRPASVSSVSSEHLSDLNDGIEDQVTSPSSPNNPVIEYPAEEQRDLRPVVRRQMRLPPVPVEARWLARTPTPPGLLATLGVSDGARLALERSASLPSLSSSSQSGDEAGEESQRRHRRTESISDDSTGSVRAQSLPDVSDSAASEEEQVVACGGSGQDGQSSDSSEESPTQQTRSGTVEGKENEGYSPAQSQQDESESDSESSGDGSPAPLRRPPQSSDS